jgi:hypothetical protein
MGSTWWRNICLLDSNVRLFEEGVDKIAGNGQLTCFCYDNDKGRG